MMRGSATVLLAANFCSASTVCSEDIVKNAASAGFFQSVYNCLQRVNSPGSQQCVAEFIGANDPSVIPTGGCRDAYQSLVDGMSASIVADCTAVLSLEPGQLPDLDCFGLGFGSSLDAFAASTGGFYPTLPTCTAAEVRAYAKDNAFLALVGSAFNSGTPWVGNIVACDYCYQSVFEPLMVAAAVPVTGILATNPNLNSACMSQSEVCFASEMMLSARAAFEGCAGWDILFEGPVCTPASVALIETLIPKPYYTFAECAYNPQTSFCHTLPAYWAALTADLDSVDCLACYTELQAEILSLAADDTNNYCATDVFSNVCIAYLGQAFTDFEVCSGSTLNVDPTSAPTMPPTTTITTTTTVETTAATTAAATTQATTSVAQTTTTKDSHMTEWSAVAAIGVLAISLL